MSYLRMYLKSAEKAAAAFSKTSKGVIIRAAIADNIEQNNFGSELSQIDIETLQGDDALLLAYAMQKSKELNAGMDVDPRFKGMIKYCQFGNLNQMSFFSEIGGILNDSGIVPLVSYDTAMKYYRPDSYRFLNETAVIAESDEQYGRIKEALSIVQYKNIDENNSFVISEKNKQTGRRVRVSNVFSVCGDNSDLSLKIIRKRCLAAELMHVQCYVPSAADIVMIALDRISKKLCYGTDFHGIAFDIWDLCYMIRKYSISQEMLRTAIPDCHQYRFAARFVNEVIPGLFPVDMLKETVFERIWVRLGNKSQWS